MLKDEIKNKSIKKNQKSNNSSQLELTCQSYNSGHVIGITP
jgi:hypothetical protein